MQLSNAILKVLWNKRKDIFSETRNKPIVERFEKLSELFTQISSFRIEEQDGKILLNGNPIFIKDDTGNPIGNADLCDYWVAANQEFSSDNNAEQKAAAGVIKMSRYFTIGKNTELINLSRLILRIGCMLGGYEFIDTPELPTAMNSQYRIKSNTITGSNDNASLTGGINQHPSAHFADNNVFYRIIQTFNEMKNDAFQPTNSKIVLRWLPLHERNEEKQKWFCDVLSHLFAYKFLYSWAHSDSMIPLFSVMMYQTICRLHEKKDADIISYSDGGIDQEYSAFIEGWKQYSKNLAAYLGIDTNDINSWHDLGKLLAIITLQEQDIKNIRDLVETGNKAIILWGPPGTGKTYQAKELVRDMLRIPAEEKIENYRFSSKSSVIHDSGAYALVQFHPNYTYEDFVGGISPQLNGTSLSYTQKIGIFKSFCDTAANYVRFEDGKYVDDGKKFIFIIDEINRADLSAVFGELLYALEYRNERINIPNFDEPFTIPSNVYLIGTMNNIDKSLVTFDLALRRRFGFFKVMPNLNLLPEILKNYNIEEEVLLKYIDRCNTLNTEIESSDELRLGEDYQIGHAYYGKIKDFLKAETQEPVPITTIELLEIWTYHLQPLLEEYLGGRLDDDNIQTVMSRLKESFVASLLP